MYLVWESTKAWRYFGLKRQSPPILQRWPFGNIPEKSKTLSTTRKELVARQRLVSPWWQRCSHTGVSWSAVGVGGTWSLPWSERWSVGEVGLSKLVRALVGQWGKCFLAERKTHSRSPGRKIIVEILFNPVCVCNDKRGKMLIFCMRNKNVGYDPICNRVEMVLSHKSFRIILHGILFAGECIYIIYLHCASDIREKDGDLDQHSQIFCRWCMVYGALAGTLKVIVVVGALSFAEGRCKWQREKWCRICIQMPCWNPLNGLLAKFDSTIKSQSIGRQYVWM